MYTCNIQATCCGSYIRYNSCIHAIFKHRVVTAIYDIAAVYMQYTSTCCGSYIRYNSRIHAIYRHWVVATIYDITAAYTCKILALCCGWYMRYNSCIYAIYTHWIVAAIETDRASMKKRSHVKTTMAGVTF